MFDRIAVVNRGEAAVRLIRAVRDLNSERDTATRTVALHTDGERAAMFVRQADDAVCLRPSATASVPYLDHAELERALRACRADAVWVGWGFVSEHPSFVDLCDHLGVTFIGPSAAAMRLLGDKIEAKLVAERVGVPVAPWSGAGGAGSYDEAREHAERIGYPLVVKAKAGGGGRGIRVVAAAEQLQAAYEGTRADAARYFGDDGVFLEKLVSGGRHVEVQVIADGYGNVWAPGVRDCSIQRRNQKIIEESASPVLTPGQSTHLRQVSTDLVREVGYQGAGTVEYLYDPATQAFAFLEVNTRLQVEHPVTEQATGLDLVKLQLLVAAGEQLPGRCPPETAHAIEVRLNAEDPDNGFAPAPGEVRFLTFPAGPGIRVDSGIAAGDSVPPEFDSMVAKIIATGRDRAEALARLRRGLRDTTVVLAGGTTNKSFLLDLLGRPEVLSGTADTGWLDRIGTAPTSRVPPYADVALYAVAIDIYIRTEALARQSFLASARGGRPQAEPAVGRDVEVRYRGTPYLLRVAQLGPERYRIAVSTETGSGTGDGDDRRREDLGTVDVHATAIGEFEVRLVLGSTRYQVVVAAGATDHLVEVDGVSHRITRDEGGVVRASAPAVVVAIPVTAGQRVEAGVTVAVLESMKMETSVAAPVSGSVREVLASVNSQVPAGTPLLRLDPDPDPGAVAASDTPRVDFAPTSVAEPDDTCARGHELLGRLRALITGYDIDAAEARSMVSVYHAVQRQLPADDPELLRAEIELLTVFADLCELSRNRPSEEEETGEHQVHSPREHLHTYLRSLDLEGEGLPDSFRDRLSRALRHYGVTDLEVTEALKDAVYRVFLALARETDQTPAVAALLERWLADGHSITGPARDELAAVLERLVAATQLRHPAVGELARRVRFRCFDHPMIVAARRAAHRQLHEQLFDLVEHPDAADRAERIEAMVANPEPVIGLLGGWIGADTDQSPLLEVLARRYYRTRDLRNVRTLSVGGRQFVTADFLLGAQQLHLVTTMADFDELDAVAAAVGQALAESSGSESSGSESSGSESSASGSSGSGSSGAGAGPPAPESVVVDIFLSWDDAPADVDLVASALRDALSAVPPPAMLRRVTVGIAGPVGAHPHYLTFRPSDGRLHEDRLIRGLHPLVAQRLDLDRLEHFHLTRLPADEDIYLFRCVAKGNAEDTRLLALAEVRDLSTLRDSTGRVIAVPAVERALSGCLDGIRSARLHRPADRRLDANRIVLAVWPTARIPMDELDDLVRTMVPMTVGAGLEEVVVLGRLQADDRGPARDIALRVSYKPGAGVQVTITDRSTDPLPTVDEYTQKVRRARARGSVYPYELVPILTGPQGTFTELDLDEAGVLRPVQRDRGHNSAGIIAGLVDTPTTRYPDGIRRVALFGDPTRALGSLAEPECARICAALDLAEAEAVPVEWFTLSSGAKISMDSGTENMDWIARVLRRIVAFTQAGGEINVVVSGINVGAQPYWNAEATMLMHTRGILVMTPDSAMVLTGKLSLDYSGGVSAEDNFGIGGYDRVMGPNGQAQYWAANLTAACEVLFAHYEHTYVAPGERFPRPAATTDPTDRDVRDYPHEHPGSDFTTVGDVFSADRNAERKKPFDIRTVMRALVDQDLPVSERWSGMADAETAVALDAHLGGRPVAVLGIESKPLPRRGRLPTDGPDTWTAGTLFPQSSKKAARAINAASGNRPLIVVANLSGFDGSPESLRKLQLEYGAEIGRAIVNFDGPIVFALVSRYHGGAFVVFSGTLHDNMQVLAVEGSYASVIGGAPAAAVVFAGEVRTRTNDDPRVRELEQAAADEPDEGRAAKLRVRLADLRTTVRSEKLGEVAAEFEAVHDIKRALQVGSVHAIIAAAQLRPQLIAAVERGMARAGE